MNFHCGKQLPVVGVVYLPGTEALSWMPTEGRATKMPITDYRAAGPARKRGSKPGGSRHLSISTPGMDLAARLRLFHRTLRGRVEHRETLVNVVRAVNSTLDPAKVADLVVERAARWIP